MKKPRYTTCKNGTYYYTATPAMKKAGFASETLPKGKTAAYERARVLNDLWDEARVATQPQLGDFNSLIAQFQRDPVWYGGLAKATKAEIDYIFAIIAKQFGPHMVSVLGRQHCRRFYNMVRDEGSAHKAAKVIKWFRRLINYSVEMGYREFNPVLGMPILPLPGRDQIWHPDQVDAIVAECIAGGRAESGNLIPPRPSIALAVLIALCTAQREQDVLAFQWNQYDGEGWQVRQQKTGKRLWVPLDETCLEMIDGLERTSTHIIVSEQTSRPYSKDAFTRIFRKFCRRAGIPDELQFRDLRRTAASDLGNKGATETEIVAFTGHEPNSSVIRTYVKPDQRAALRGFKKRSE